ncbi:unnamed protein product [Ilex paraguariensis]|uniref:Uncharacterized protein n=1 Tax=Ilex paraguariensis TaxID=185542 RepID=A0ABC8R882_9AQUA
MLDLRENQVEALGVKQEEYYLQGSLEEKQIEIVHVETVWPDMEEKGFEGFLKDVFDKMSCSVEEKKVEPWGTESNKVVEEHKKGSLLRSGSEAIGSKISDITVKSADNGDGRECTFKETGHSQRNGANVNGGEYNSKVESSRISGYNLGSYESMRKEREWKRTLACKLFEERHNVDGDEGMDSLWETYETDSSKANPKSNTKKKKKKKRETEYYEDDDEEEETDGQLCCLQALKFSTGKMNLGMGRPNLVRITKALKGIGWLHRVSSHGKKDMVRWPLTIAEEQIIKAQ